MRRFINVVLLVLIVILLILVARSTSAEWYSGIVHVHSTFSDGTRPPVVLKIEAVSLFLSFMIVTDHFEQINSEKKWTGKYTDDFGLDKYLKDYTFEKPYVCVAGTEISKNGCHTIAMRNIDEIFKIEKIGPNVPDLLAELSKHKSLPIACHPNLKQYPYDLSLENTADLSGVEFFNDSGSDGYRKTRRSYLDLISQGRKLFVTSGCDSHTEAQVTSMRKLTMVWSNEDHLTSEELFKSFEQGQTCATNNGAYFLSQNLTPQFNAQEVDRPKFEFTIGFPVITVSKKTIRIYRDGKLADGSSIILPSGKTEYTYLWKDTQVPKGEHSYVIEMEGCLVTSPICLDVKDDQPTPPKVSQDGYDDWSPQAIASNNGISDFFLGFGHRIAFLSNRSGRTIIYQADFNDEKKLEKIVPFYDISNFIERFSFSSDGRAVLLVGKKNEIYVLVLNPDKDTKQIFDLHLQDKGSFFPTWTDGLNFYFAADNGQIRLVEINREFADDGETVNSLTTELKDVPEDMQFFTTSKDKNGFEQLCFVDAAVKVKKWLTKGSFDNTCPSIGRVGAIVPMGTNGPVVFSTKKKGNFDLAVLQDDNKSLVIITPDRSNETEPCWAFNCQEIFFVSDRTGHKKIGRMNTEDMKQKILNLK